MAQHVPKSILTHSQRVCRLYKKAYRLIESKHDARINFRLEAVVLRHRFDETRKEDDWRKLAAMLEEGEHEVWAEQHPQPFYFKVGDRSKRSLIDVLTYMLKNINVNRHKSSLHVH